MRPLTTPIKDTSSFYERQFIDRIKLKLTAGNGASGAIAFHRDRLTKYGAPNGGDGGDGGSIVLKSIKFLNDFSKFHHYHYRGNNGKAGGRNMKIGKPGGNLTLHVPIGT